MNGGKPGVFMLSEISQREKDKYRMIVTGSQLIMLTAGQANQTRDKAVGQGMATLFRKPADREDGTLVSQRIILSRFGY